MRLEACVFNLMQIGELAKTSLGDDIKEQIPSIPWKQIYGMRKCQKGIRAVCFSGSHMSEKWT